jgi:hypothetical protein
VLYSEEKAESLVLLGFHQEAKGLPNGYAFFCRKTRDVFGVEVYRKSTGIFDLGKSAGKDLGST